jgi:polyphosphate glucokinase
MTQPILGLDVGGSSIKAGLVDVATGELRGPLRSVPTPQPSTADRLVDCFVDIDRESGVAGPVGLAVPCVVKHGVARTAANIDKSWIGLDGAGRLGARLQRPVTFLNDADAAGVAEMRLGAGRGCDGTVMLLTLGTGIGSALFSRGVLVPNTELGHLEVDGHDAETRASARVRTAENLDWPAWAQRLNRYLEAVHALFWPDVFILGGAVTENFAAFAPLLHSPAEIRVARFGGQAGVVGAALAAADPAAFA